MPFPSGISLEGVLYPIKKGNGAFSIDHQPTVVQQADLAGSSRPSKTARPDTLTWRWDDWSLGEGQTWITPDVAFAEISVGGSTDSFKRYLSSDLAVDISVPGQVSLGKVATVESTSIGTVTGSTGPHLVVLGEKPWAIWDTSAKERTAANTWTSRTTNAAGSSYAHRSTASGTYVYIAYRGATGIQYLNSSSAGAVFTTSPSESIRIVDGRIFALQPSVSGNVVKLFRSPDLVAPATMTLIGSTQEFTSEGGMTSVGNDVYFVLTALGVPPTVYRYDGTAMSLFAKLPNGFRVWQTSTGENEYAICEQNGVLFVGGYYPGVTNDTATVQYLIPGGPSGTIGKIREGTDIQVTTVFADSNNGILIGTDSGQVWRYDMGTGGLSLFISGQSASALGGGRVHSFAQAAGLYFASMRDGSDTGSVYSTLVGTYPNETIITGSKWDYLFPEEEKSFLSVTITANIPSGCTVKFAYKMDDGSLITTDASGATMSTTTSGTTSFTISNAGTERIFRTLQPYLYLDTNTGGDSKSTPTVYSVLMKATTTGKQKFINCTIDLSNQGDANRPSGSNLTGSKLGQALETLIENGSNRFITVKVPFEKTDLPYPRAEDTYVCTIHQSHIEYQSAGQGFAQLVLRIVP